MTSWYVLHATYGIIIYDAPLIIVQIPLQLCSDSRIPETADVYVLAFLLMQFCRVGLFFIIITEKTFFTRCAREEGGVPLFWGQLSPCRCNFNIQI